jgi:hypothetical protein
MGPLRLGEMKPSRGPVLYGMTRTVRTVAILFGAAIVLLGLRVAMIFTHQPSDQDLIQQALTASLEASKKGEAGGVLDLLSKQFKVNQGSAPDTSEIADFIRRVKPDIQLEDRHALITGDQARIVTPVDLSMLGQSMQLKDVMLVFHKEQGHGFLFLPTPQWHLTEVRLPESQLPNLTGP